MKQKNVFSYVAMFVLLFVMQACSDDLKVITMLSDSADFVVTNTTTGESKKNQGLQIFSNALTVHNGDVLELVYTPTEEYEKYAWKVDFKLFNDEVKSVSKSPYSLTYTVNNLEAGEYYISCTAKIADSDVEFEGADTGGVFVEVVEE